MRQGLMEHATSGRVRQSVRLFLILGAFWGWLQGSTGAAAFPSLAQAHTHTQQTQPKEQILSPFWPPLIQQWGEEIKPYADIYGLDPDLIAAVINAESNGVPDLVSRAGAVGLMGVLPSGPGMEWRPTPEALKDPIVNLNWGGAILADIIQQAGGDIAAALAAYSGGWDNATRRVPREYAIRVLHEYGQAIAVRAGMSPEIASHWTIAIQTNKGHIAPEGMLFGQQPVSGIFMFGEHIAYQAVTPAGKSFYVRAYAVPVVLVVPQHIPQAEFSHQYSLDPHLIARVGLADGKGAPQNAYLILACLPSLRRLRGQLSTRWFAPSGCPTWYRQTVSSEQ